jgi:biopolymer transport protein TolQ
MNEAVTLAITNESLSMIDLIIDASLLVQLVMLILVAASVVSWTLIFTKASAFKRLRQEADRFDEIYYSGEVDLNDFWRDLSGESEESTGMANIFIKGYGEHVRLTDDRLPGTDQINKDDIVDGVHRVMRVALSREVEELESRLSFLATVGSTSPYVGLFGTVWGIMNSFRSLGAMQSVSIATVAPGISEALIATAMGLFAAIPAVIAYNRFSNDAEKLVSRYDIFMEEFLSIVSRHALTRRRAKSAV